MHRSWLPTRALALFVLIAGTATSCDNRALDGQISSASSPPITAERCESQAGFIFVDAGDFIAGSDRKEREYAYRISAEGFADSPDEVAQAEMGYRARGWFDQEPARETVNLPAFCLSENLITNVDYQVFVNAAGHRAPGISESDYIKQGYLVHDYTQVKPYLWEGNNYPSGQGQHPVVLISYEDALAYAEWRSQRDGVTYRLPTAHEWEKAARGTDGRYFPWGNTWQNEATNWSKNGPYGTSRIGSYPVSQGPYGHQDMAGNVFEYTSTLVDKPGSEREVLLKSCGWDDYPGFCRAAYEHDRPVDARHILFGFRLIMEE